MPHPIHRVTRFGIVGPYLLAVAFSNGTEQRIDFQPVLHGVMFGPLRDLATFNAVVLDSEGRHAGVAERSRFRPGDAPRLAGRAR